MTRADSAARTSPAARARVAVFLALTAPLLAGHAPSARAWDSVGHMSVAEVAWAALAKDEGVRAAIEKTLFAHPYRERDLAWSKAAPSERVRLAFVLAATWPDLIRRQDAAPPEKPVPFHPFFDEFYGDFAATGSPPSEEDKRALDLFLRAWHHHDVEILDDGAGMKAKALGPLGTAPKRPQDVTEAAGAVAWARGVLEGTVAPQSSDEMKAFALCWLEHLVGDLHQPLQCAQRDGDRGSNGLALPREARAVDLHAYWDGLLDAGGGSDPAAIAKALADGDPLAQVGPLETDGVLDLHLDRWIQSGADLAAQRAYMSGDRPLRTAIDAAKGHAELEALFARYRADAMEVARGRALLAGLRLAEILRQVFGKKRIPPADAAPGAKEAAKPLPPYEHVVVVVEENKDYGQIIDKGPHPAAPYINRIRAEGASLTAMFAEEHHSQGNYFWLFSGSNQGIGFEDAVPQRLLEADNLAGHLIAKGKTFKGYSESLPEIGFAGERWPLDKRLYGRKHVPWISFSSAPNGATVATSCNLTFEEFPKTEADFSRLPNVAFVIPNLKNDMHDGLPEKSIPRGDRWLELHLDGYRTWAADHKSLLIVTFDENDDRTGIEGLTDPATNDSDGDREHVDRRNRIATVFSGWRVKRGFESAAKATHVNLLRTLEAIFDLPPSGAQQPKAAAAGIGEDPIREVFD